MLLNLLFMSVVLAVLQTHTPTEDELAAAEELDRYTIGLANRGDIVYGISIDPTLGEETWKVRTVGPKLMITGGDRRGLRYAISHFLEDVCGVRFWSDSETDIPEGVTADWRNVNLSGKPVFEYRDIYRTSNKDTAAPELAVWRRLNRNGSAGIPDTLGGQYTWGGPDYVHTFDLYVPWSKYKDSHPEYFSIIDGQRKGGRTSGQLCLSNADVKKLLKEGFLSRIAAAEASAKANGTIAPKMYDLSQNDWTQLCQCEECTKADQEIGYSGQYLNFINEVADEVKAKYPGVYVTTLAYEKTETPPKGGITPRDNVIIRLCDTRSSEVLPLTDATNKETYDIITSWGKIAKNLMIWDYAGVYKNPPVVFTIPSEFTLADDYRFFKTNNVMGVFYEHEGEDRDFHTLKYYLVSRLLEDPFQDGDAIILDYCKRYFGEKAGEKIYAIRHRLHEVSMAAKPMIHFMAMTDAFDYLERDELEALALEWDAAEALADEDKLARVKKARANHNTMLRFRRGSPKVVGNKYVYAPETLMEISPASGYTLVDDENLKGRKALVVRRSSFQPSAFASPLRVALWASTQGKYVFEGTIEYELDGDYKWYDLGTVEIPENTQNVFYIGNDWNLHNTLAKAGLNGKQANLKVSLKATASEIRIGGYIFTVAE